jgi:predicted transcriptional regulator
MTLTLTPETEALIQQEMSSGRFRDPDEAIATAFLVLRDYRPADLGDLDRNIQEGIDDADAGRLYTEDEARAYIASVRAKL